MDANQQAYGLVPGRAYFSPRQRQALARRAVRGLRPLECFQYRSLTKAGTDNWIEVVSLRVT